MLATACLRPLLARPPEGGTGGGRRRRVYEALELATPPMAAQIASPLTRHGPCLMPVPIQFPDPRGLPVDNSG